jgi:Leucine-rich repeat (LRR) protein
VTRGELEYLDLSQNALESIEGLESLPSVTYVNLGSSLVHWSFILMANGVWATNCFVTENNVITRLDIAGSMSRLRCLRLSDNRLEGSLDVRALGNVRILYADRNRITGITHGEKMKTLETLSLRYQSGKGL